MSNGGAPAPETVAVTGATGIVGRFVVADLQARGVQVRALCRANADRSGYSREPVWVEGDMSDSSALRRLLTDTDAVVHCAFAHQPGRYRGGEGDAPVEFWRQNLLSSIDLLETCTASRVQSCILLSSRAVFGSGRSQLEVNDQDALQPDTHYGALKVAEEALAQRYRASSSLRVHAVRATGVFGPTHSPETHKWWPLVKHCLDAARQGRPIEISERVSTEVAGSDLAEAIWRLLGCNAESQLAFNCSDLRLRTSELATLITSAAGYSGAITAAQQAAVRLTRNSSEPMNGPTMLCPGLARLGWQPNGQQHLAATIRELVAYYAQRSDKDRAIAGSSASSDTR